MDSAPDVYVVNDDTPAGIKTWQTHVQTMSNRQAPILRIGSPPEVSRTAVKPKARHHLVGLRAKCAGSSFGKRQGSDSPQMLRLGFGGRVSAADSAAEFARQRREHRCLVPG